MRFSILSFIAALFVIAGTASVSKAGFVYSVVDAVEGNQIYGFSANETTGELTLLAGFPVATGFIGGGNTNLEHIVYDPVNKFLFVANRGSSNISVYSVNTMTGAIAPASFSPIASVANQRTLKVHPSGSPLIVGADNFASFVITATSATPAPGSPYTMPTGVSPAASAMSPDGSYYYAGGNTGNFFAGMSVNSSTGELTPITGSPFDSTASNPVPVDVDSTGRLFVYGSRQAAMRIYTLASGVPTAVAGTPFTAGEVGFASVAKLHPNGNFLMLPNRTRAHVYSYAVGGSGAATTFSVVAGSPFGTGGTTSLAGVYNPAGTFFYVANAGSRNLTRFAVNPSTGVLSGQVVQAANTLGSVGSLSGIAYVPEGPMSGPVTISGRIMRANGTGVSGARVNISGPNGFSANALTGSFGYFTFNGILSDRQYTITIVSKLATFGPTLITPSGDVTGLEIFEVPTFSPRLSR
ncbi:MAG: beta-propeller fold lactonase family protein [Chloracidobacterium sp.]|nr:beta-propeller fold lactonase family protein [Chloracidobacterium sp.]MCC6826123.1 beta-propeller fold lactonase family protein [Acidobacteriota bacterium]MCO5333316.1 beta-propeller fold lactonase family protein [Pyrinomonadaceae bacterium]